MDLWIGAKGKDIQPWSEQHAFHEYSLQHLWPFLHAFVEAKALTLSHALNMKGLHLEEKLGADMLCTMGRRFIASISHKAGILSINKVPRGTKPTLLYQTDQKQLFISPTCLSIYI